MLGKFSIVRTLLVASIFGSLVACTFDPGELEEEEGSTSQKASTRRGSNDDSDESDEDVEEANEGARGIDASVKVDGGPIHSDGGAWTHTDSGAGHYDGGAWGHDSGVDGGGWRADSGRF